VLAAGIWIGDRGLQQVSAARFRELVLNLLIVIAALGVLRALVALIKLRSRRGSGS
jgi:uncharacterized membrane protein YfcA